VTLDQDQQTIAFDRSDMEINLGSVGKGYTLDRCAELMAEAGIEHYLMHGGQSSILARGSPNPQSGADGWTVAVRHPLRSERRLAEITLTDQALGTSGSGQQFFYHRGQRLGHVLDARTGWPAAGVLSATVVAPSAAAADALATAFFVLGPDAAQTICAEHDELSALFVLPGQRHGTVTLASIGLDQQLVVLDAQ